MTGKTKSRSAFEAGYRAAAEIILADVAEYGGEGALLVLWAWRLLERGDSLVAELKARAGLEPAGQTERKEAA
jgi:hypothetical protein